MSHETPKPDAGLLSRLPKPSHRQRRLIAMCGAACIVIVGLGAFAFAAAGGPYQDRGEPTMLAANDADRAARPRMLENSAPFSFADLVERVSPAVVTITSETTTTDSDGDDANSAAVQGPVPPVRPAPAAASRTRR